MNYPYDDANMIYDHTIHGYVLTPEGARALAGADLAMILDPTGDCNPSTMPTRELQAISLHFYTWIYSHSNNQRFVEWLLAKYPPCRELVQTCLINELRYALKNGDFWNYADDDHGLDKEVSKMTRYLLECPLPNGINLLYQGNLPFTVGQDKYRVGY